jgi:high frequency lysogenization protein
MNKLENQTLALAGMFQAASLVDELALKGSCDSSEFDCSVGSLFTIEAESPRDALGDLGCLSHGFTALAGYLSGENAEPGRNIAYYLLSMLKLARQVLHSDVLSEKLLKGLHDIDSARTDFNLGRASVIARIDGLYQECISDLSPRILVRGEQTFLRNNDNAAKIRALLLAGIRAAVLWQQLGGSRWSLFWSRRKYIATAKKLLSYN